MRLLLRLLSLVVAFGSLLFLSGQTQFRDRGEGKPSTLESQGLYPVLVYEGRPLPLGEIVKVQERWQGLLNSEEVKWSESWTMCKFQRSPKLLLVVDGDDRVYLAKSLDGFEPVGYIKKKGVMKRIRAMLLKELLHGLEESPIHFLLSFFGI